MKVDDRFNKSGNVSGRTWNVCEMLSGMGVWKYAKDR